MQEHSTIFSIKEIRNRVKIAFINGISNFKQKIEIIENWQKNINNGKYLKAKEEEISPLFLTQFFGDILGYDYNNSSDWNLRLENKTETDSTKSDAALGYFKFRNNEELHKDVRAVIEIKNAQTPLDKPQNRKDFKGSPVEQAFMYAAKIGEKCNWVIVSNFLEIRLYLANDMTKYESFDILALTDNYEFSRFYYILSHGQLFLENMPSVIEILLKNRIEKEKTITKEFYEYYHFLRELFFYHLKTHNPTIQPFQLLEYAQTIIDRIVFISVVKDYELMPYHVIKEIEEISSKSWAKDTEEIWRQLKMFFLAIDDGLPPRIYKFNGGLFRQNSIIDDLNINNVFLKRLFVLNTYDFESDLNVNVLGHIFEQSITDIELLKKNITENKHIEYFETDDEIDLKIPKTETNKRKKEGIFYTPEIITQYIVKSTVGAWLENKKNQIGLNDLIDFPINDQGKEFHISLWEQYKTVLKEIKILDPACGSGAFLTKTYDYLLREWQIVFDVIDKLKGEKIELRSNGLFSSAPTKMQESISQIKKDIVNNNLFGVDLNSESVEITKLGLWLKSASKKDPLALLDRNIKCGNSLISDKSITEKAFDWTEGFMNLYNPEKYYEISVTQYEQWIVEAQQELEELITERKTTPKEWRNTDKLVEKINRQKVHINDLVYELKMLHEWKKTNPQSFNGFDVVVGNPPYIFTRDLITEAEKNYFKEKFDFTQFKLNTYILFIEKSYHLLNNEGYFGFIVPNTWLTIENTSDFRKFVLTNTFDIKIVNSHDKIFNDANVDTSILIFSKKGTDSIEISELLNDNISLINKTKKQDFLNSINFVINYNSNFSIHNLLNKIDQTALKLSEIANVNNGILAYEVGAGKPVQTEEIRDKRLFHSTEKHSNEWIKYVDGVDVQRYFLGWSGQYVKYGQNLGRQRKPELFRKDRILVRQIPSSPPYSILATYVTGNIINDNNSMIITSHSNDFELLYLLSLINSKLISFWFLKTFGKLQRKLFPQFKVNELLLFPIKPIDKQEQQVFADFAKNILEINKTINDRVYKFKSNLITNFEKLKITQNLIEFYTLDFKEFIDELAKQKIKINLKKQDEWSDYFKEHKYSINELILNFNALNTKIDLAVYKLYDLTTEEIQLIEKQ